MSHLSVFSCPTVEVDNEQCSGPSDTHKAVTLLLPSNWPESTFNSESIKFIGDTKTNQPYTSGSQLLDCFFQSFKFYCRLKSSVL